MTATAAGAPPLAQPAGGAPPAVETQRLRKEYRRHVALHGLDLVVGPGEVFGFLGANGAGKTTTVKILTGLVRPTSGTARLFGKDVADPQARRLVGYLPELFRFQDWLTGSELLELHGRLIGIPADGRREAADRALERVGLAGRGGDRIKGYSKGMTQRIGLAQALLGDPRLVLLDEPTSALDPVGRRDVRDLIGELRAEGVTVLLNSHLLSEVELVCDRVAIVDRGRVVYSGGLDELTSAAPTVRIGVEEADDALIAALAGLGEVSRRAERTLDVALRSGIAPAAVAETVVQGGWRLASMVPITPSLEDAFMRLVDGGTA